MGQNLEKKDTKKGNKDSEKGVNHNNTGSTFVCVCLSRHVSVRSTSVGTVRGTRHLSYLWSSTLRTTHRPHTVFEWTTPSAEMYARVTVSSRLLSHGPRRWIRCRRVSPSERLLELKVCILK